MAELTHELDIVVMAQVMAGCSTAESSLNVNRMNKCTLVIARPDSRTSHAYKRGSARAEVACHAHKMATKLKSSLSLALV